MEVELLDVQVEANPAINLQQAVRNRDIDIVVKKDSVKMTQRGEVPSEGPGATDSSISLHLERAFHNGIYSGLSSTPNTSPSGIVAREGGMFDYDDLDAISMTFSSDLLYGQAIEYLDYMGTRRLPSGSVAVIVGNNDYRDDAINRIPRVEYILDPMRDYAPIGCTVMLADGRRIQEVGIDYETGGDGVYKPRELVMSYFDPNTQVLESAFVMRVHRFDVNSPIDDSEFEIEFPHGTEVDDKIRGFSYTIGIDDPIDEPIVLEEQAVEAAPATSPKSTPKPTPPPIRLQPYSPPPPQSFWTFARIGFGVTCLISGLALFSLLLSMRRKG